MDRLDAMSVFAAIVDGGSLSAAGRRLNVPLATVSRKLADLEAHLKTRLITRSTRKLVLTDAGRDYLAACRQILEQVDEAERAASGAYAKVKGQLVMAAPIVFGRLHVVPVAAAFLEAHPEVDIQLRLGDRNVNLIEEHVDVALRIGALPDSNLVATQVGTIRRVVCASPDYLERFGTPQSLDDLAAHRCITLRRPGGRDRLDLRRRRRPEAAGAVHSRMTVSTADAAIEAAVLGLGLTRVLSYQVADALRDGRLVRVLVDDEPPAVPASLIYPGQGRLPMKTRAFIDFAVGRLRDRLSALDAKGAARSATATHPSSTTAAKAPAVTRDSEPGRERYGSRPWPRRGTTLTTRYSVSEMPAPAPNTHHASREAGRRFVERGRGSGGQPNCRPWKEWHGPTQCRRPRPLRFRSHDITHADRPRGDHPGRHAAMPAHRGIAARADGLFHA